MRSESDVCDVYISLTHFYNLGKRVAEFINDILIIEPAIKQVNICSKGLFANVFNDVLECIKKFKPLTSTFERKQLELKDGACINHTIILTNEALHYVAPGEQPFDEYVDYCKYYGNK